MRKISDSENSTFTATYFTTNFQFTKVHSADFFFLFTQFIMYLRGVKRRGEISFFFFLLFFFRLHGRSDAMCGRKYIHYAIRQRVKLAYSARYILRTRDNFIAIENLYSLRKIWKLIVYPTYTDSFHERVASHVKTNYRLNSYPIPYPSPWAS